MTWLALAGVWLVVALALGLTLGRAIHLADQYRDAP